MSYGAVAPITHQRDLFPIPITALSFDPVADVIWAGNNAGSVVAYDGQSRMRGVMFPVGDHLPVMKVAASESQIRATTSSGSSLGAWSKGGVNAWTFRPNDAFIGSFAPSPSSSHILACGTSVPELALINTSTGTPIRSTPLPSPITHLHFSHSHLVSGSADGYIRIHDVRMTMRRDDAGGEHAVKAHSGGLQGLDGAGNNIYTIGWGLRQSRPVTDQFIKVYDLRMLRALSPISFLAGAGFINVHPRQFSTIIATSTQGLVNIIDINEGSAASEFFQMDVASCVTCSAVNPTGSYIGFGDADGVVHLYSTDLGADHAPFNGFEGHPSEWADISEPLPSFEWNDDTPLNSIGMPFYDSMLLSASLGDSLQHHVTPYYPPPVKVPLQVYNSMKTVDFVGYAALPKELRGKRNLAYTVPSLRGDSGRFRSNKSKGTVDSPVHQVHSSEVPSSYRKVEIEYSRFGVEDFDFAFYNKTEYSGLETHILNSYTNALLQTMHYTIPVRRLAKSHITLNCQREHCLLCELGFVVRMLEDAKGINCQAANFCKTVSALPQAAQMGLVDYGTQSMSEPDYVSIIQSFNRFMLELLVSEGNNFPHNPRVVPLRSDPRRGSGGAGPAPAPITQLFGIDAKSVIVCGNCGARRDKEGLAHVVEMIYPKRMSSNDIPPQSDFASLLRNALVRDMSYRATCQTCKQLTPQHSRRIIPASELPPILSVNACVYSDDHLQYWQDGKQGRFLKSTVTIRTDDEVRDLGVVGEDVRDAAVYELRAVVVAIREKGTHLVSIIKVPDASSSALGSPWYIFNDFAVRNVTEDEALSFAGKWKVPAVLHLERVDLPDPLDFSGLPEVRERMILSFDANISLARDKSLIKHEALRYEELPTPGMLVAIDAEFVLMQEDETEYRSDGVKKIIRPSRFGLARVSVLRGDGPKQGAPFIDDHIHTSETIVDYLTEWSGIKFGDLDPHMSKYTLVPLKVAYKKLRLLVDSGCIFIGHGLAKDFRTINIFVPPDQVLDTVDLYHLRGRQRKLSLRFLSWFILGENIQTETHDSIEDANCALKLYKAFHEFEAQAIFDEKLEELYREGRKVNFKPPTSSGVAHSSSPPPQGGAVYGLNANGSATHVNPSNAFNYWQSQLDSAYPQSHSATPPPNFFSHSSGALQGRTPSPSSHRQHSHAPSQSSWRSRR